MDGETSAIWFLENLDQVQNGAMVLYLTNGRVAGQASSATADEAYIIAKNRKTSSARVADSRGIIANGAIFMLADEVRALAFISSLVGPNKKPRPAVRDRALKPWRIMTDAEKEDRKGSYMLQVRRGW